MAELRRKEGDLTTDELASYGIRPKHPEGPKLTPVTVTGHPPGLESQIRERAFEIFQERRNEDGHELDDWLRAEEEITSQETRTAT
jgi:Protein of unknown function (DUF2934)